MKQGPVLAAVPSQKGKAAWAIEILADNINSETVNTREGKGNGGEEKQGEGRARTRMSCTTILYTTPFLHHPKRTKLLTTRAKHQNVHVDKQHVT